MEYINPALLEILSGDGDSEETAVLFAPCHVRIRTIAELLFIERKFGAQGIGWDEEMHYTSTSRQSVWKIRLANGSTRSVFFETSNTLYDK